VDKEAVVDEAVDVAHDEWDAICMQDDHFQSGIQLFQEPTVNIGCRSDI
jgi:hypothetical protein